MIPSEPPLIIDKGIAVYAPYLYEGCLRVEIYFSPNNPLLSFMSCSNTQHKIWETTSSQSPTGTLFIYQTDLTLGFYTVVLSNPSLNKSGSLIVSILRPTKRVVVGLPYSIYPPIDMTD